MSLRTQIWMAASLLVLGGLAFSNANVSAGDKKSGAILSKSGELRDDDEKDTKRTNSPRRVFTVKLEEGKTYQINLKSKSDGYDPFLRLEDSTGNEVASDDDGGGFDLSDDDRDLLRPVEIVVSDQTGRSVGTIDDPDGRFLGEDCINALGGGACDEVTDDEDDARVFGFLRHLSDIRSSRARLGFAYLRR